MAYLASHGQRRLSFPELYRGAPTLERERRLADVYAIGYALEMGTDILGFGIRPARLFFQWARKRLMMPEPKPAHRPLLGAAGRAEYATSPGARFTRSCPT